MGCICNKHVFATLFKFRYWFGAFTCVSMLQYQSTKLSLVLVRTF